MSSDGSDDESYEVGQEVSARQGPGQPFYPARILDMRESPKPEGSSVWRHMVHWKGWNKRFDKWLTVKNMKMSEGDEHINPTDPVPPLLLPRALLPPFSPRATAALQLQHFSRGLHEASCSLRSPARLQNADMIYEVDNIMMHRTRPDGGVVEFKVRWKDHGREFDSWEPEENFGDKSVVQEYWQEIERKKLVEQKPEEVHFEQSMRRSRAYRRSGCISASL